MRPRVLIVDDSLTVRMDIGEALQSAGFDTVLCADLRSAREALAREGAVLVVLDILLPDGDGLDFLKELRSSPATAQIPVLLLSTEAEVKNRVRGMGAGAEEYIGKPYDLGQVVARARTLTQADAIATGGETSPSLLGPNRLLAVDDSITYLQELGSQLRQEGYDVVLAASGEEALELLAAQPVDCILLDLIMPGLSGQDTCRRIKQRAEWRDIPLVMLTARDDRHAMIEGINAGADDYIAKSADFDVLKARLRAQLRRKHFEDENRRIREKLVRRETEATARKQVEAEQKLLDQRLRDQQFYTRSLIESNIDAIMTTDPAGIITDVNKQMEALTGCTRDELIGAPFKKHFTDPERAEAAIKLVLSEKKVTNYELTARARDGKTTVVSYNATTFYDRNRRLQGVFAAARDVTERKHIEQMLQEKNVELESAKSVAEQTVERLKEVERLKQGFLSTVSHELRTPLTSIRGSLGLLASGAVGALSDEVVEVVAIAERNAVRLIALINDILDLERLETGKIELQFAQVSTESVLRRAIESVGTFVQEHGITIEASEVSSTIWADADRIVQVLVNLLSNAVKFSPPGGVVTIGVGLRESWVEFRVTDRGRGVPVTHRRAIFERFRQVETSDAREKGGMGLGLAICKSIIEQHGGTIGVESEEGGGSTFWFRVAIALRPVAPRLGRAILVCGGDAERRGFFEQVVRQAGYNTVITVPDADAAWDVLQGGDVAVVLLKGDSELLARIRKEPAFGAVPVILFGSPLVVSPEALSDSLVLFLPERVDSRELLAAIRDGLERGRVAAQARYVLLVEDDLTLLDVMARQLSREGIAVRTATTGEEAIRVAEAEPPALMVLDVGLPERDGFDVVDTMRQRPELRGIPVLVYTGRDLTEEQRGRLRLGPTRFLTKSKASDEDFRRLVVELRQIPLPLDGGSGHPEHRREMARGVCVVPSPGGAGGV